MSEKIEIHLIKPVNTGTGEMTLLCLREPTLKDHKAFAGIKINEDGINMSMGDMMETAQLAAEVLGGLTPGEAGSIGIQDGVAIFTALSPFFGDGQAVTGQMALPS
jgi:hypothetical protein